MAHVRNDVSTLNVFRGMLLSVLLSVLVFWLPLVAVVAQLWSNN